MQDTVHLNKIRITFSKQIIKSSKKLFGFSKRRLVLLLW